MLSAFNHQIQELERKVEQQDEEIGYIKTRQQQLESFASCQTCDCKTNLDTIQSKVNSNYLRINELATKFDKLDVGFDVEDYGSEMTDASAFVEDSPCFSPAWKAPGSRGPTPNLVPQGYESPPMSLYTAKEFFAAVSFANASDEVTTNNSQIDCAASANSFPAASSFAKKNPWSFDNPKIKEPPQKQSNSFGFGDQQNQYQKEDVAPAEKSSSFTADNVASIASENSHLKQQLLMYRQKVSDMEEKLKCSDASVDDLRMIREHFVQKEREWNQRVEWFEHKLKLLKQDKRRRGETIGKLLKCIDDMKDSGRLDESRVKEGRAVLSATLNSRGLHTEERIVRVVEAVELDRVPRTPPATVTDSGTDNPAGEKHTGIHTNLTNENKNNSSFCKKPSFEDLDTEVYIEAEFLAEKHGFITIDQAEYLAEKRGFPVDDLCDIEDVEMM